MLRIAVAVASLILLLACSEDGTQGRTEPAPAQSTPTVARSRTPTPTVAPSPTPTPSLQGSGGGFGLYRGIQFRRGDLQYDPSDPEDRDCRDFNALNDATAFWLAAGGPEQDSYWLDPDRDGNPCEGMLMWIAMSTEAPPKPTAAPPSSTPTAKAMITPRPLPISTLTATAIPASDTTATPTPTLPATIRNEVYEDRVAELALAWARDNADAVASMVAETVMASTAIEAVPPLGRPQLRSLLRVAGENELGHWLSLEIAEVNFHGDDEVSATLLVGGTVMLGPGAVEAVDLTVPIVVTVDPESQAAVMGQADVPAATVTIR